MIIDYRPLAQDDVKFADIADAQGVTFRDLRAEVVRLYDEVAEILNDLEDRDITFVPYDPEANDPYAETEAEKHIGWTLGHLVAHVTATNEETAVFSSLLARGIPQSGRIRTETPWEEIDTVVKARARLEESRRIVLAYLRAIPDEPDLTTLRAINNEKAAAYFGPLNAIAQMISGLAHHAGHLDQFRDVRAQAIAARAQTVNA